MSYINPVEEYHNKLKPYRDDYDKYMQSFICPKCHEGVTDLEFLADKSSFTLVNETDKAETWCCRECTTEIETIKMPKVDDYYVPEIEVFGEDDIFNKNYMETIGFKVISDDGKCGKAIHIRSNGMTVLSWNRDGADQTYFGEKFDKKSCFFGIGKDGGTRTAFNGYIFSREDIEKVLSLTW